VPAIDDFNEKISDEFRANPRITVEVERVA